MTVDSNIEARTQAEELFSLLVEANDEYGNRFAEEFRKLFDDKYPRPAVETTSPVIPLPDDAARMFGHHVMAWGLHEGEAINDVPLNYLEGIVSETSSVFRFKYMLNRYLANKRIHAED